MNENDLRVIKTRENIEATFLHMMKEKDFSQITLSDLIKECRIAKGTFYYHYKDKYDLVEQVMKEQFRNYDELLVHHLHNSEESTDSIDAIFAVLMEITNNYIVLLPIRTAELDAKQELNNFLSSRLLRILETSETKKISNPEQVSKLIAAMMIVQMEMMYNQESKPGKMFLDNIAGVIHYLQFMLQSVPNVLNEKTDSKN